VFIAIEADLDVRYGSRDGVACAEFSWDGFDDGSPASGRGWAASGTAGRLVGQIFIHKGDDSGFVAEREWLLQQPARAVTLSSAARDVDLSGFGVLRICLNGRSVFELDHPQKHRRIGDARR
jgi:hypothetical protein